MPTYTIVDNGTDPLGPNEVLAGTHIQVSDGDVFIIASSADANITFQAAGGVPADFEIVFAGSNANGFDIKVEGDLTPAVTVPDNSNLAGVKFDAKAADSVTFSAGNNVSFGQFDGSDTGADVITIGDGFTTDRNWKTGGGDDIITVGNNATFENIDTDVGNDSVTFGDGATVHDLDTKAGNDSVRFGDDLNANNVKTGDGDDDVYIGNNAQVSEVDGGGGSGDSYTTQTTGTNSKDFETTEIVCFAKGTFIQTPGGHVAIEDLHVGSMVRTIDHGVQPVRWIGSMKIDHSTLAAKDRLWPIRIAAGSLGEDVPSADLVVSPQHRVLLRSRIVRRMFGQEEIFVPAKLLTFLPGVRCECPPEGVEYYHVLFARHEVLVANGAESESLYIGPHTLNALGFEALSQIETLGLMPKRLGEPVPTARYQPRDRRKLRQLLERHVKNEKPPVVRPSVHNMALTG